MFKFSMRSDFGTSRRSLVFPFFLWMHLLINFVLHLCMTNRMLLNNIITLLLQAVIDIKFLIRLLSCIGQNILHTYSNFPLCFKM